MKASTLILSLGAGVAVLAASLIHGAVTHRWQVTRLDSERTSKIHQIRLLYRDYMASDISSELPVLERSVVSCREYYSPTLRQSVTVSLTSGPTGAVATHTPDVCYPASGYQAIFPREKNTIELPEGRQATYYWAEYEKKSSSKIVRHRIRWAWATQEGTWVAPEYPRFAFLKSPELYKIYIVTPETPRDDDTTLTEPEQEREFVRHALHTYSRFIRGE